MYMAMSGDSTCRGLRSPRDGTLVMELTKGNYCVPIGFDCERLKSQNRVSTELEADWQSWWGCKQLPLPINSCYEAALGS